MTAIDVDPGVEANPLVTGLEREPVRSTALVIFGAMGDLASRKLLPGIYNLAHEGALPERIALIGVSRSATTERAEFRAAARESNRALLRRRPDPDVLEGLLANFQYASGTFDDEDLYGRLREALDGLDAGLGTPLNRIFYLSTAPEFMPLGITGAPSARPVSRPQAEEAPRSRSK